MCKDPIFLAILLVLIAGYPSATTSSYSLFNPRRFLTDTKGNSIAKGSSHAPRPVSGLYSSGGKSGDNKQRKDVPIDPEGSSVSDECLKVPEACRDGNKLTACLVHSGAASSVGLDLIVPLSRRRLDSRMSNASASASKDAFLILQNGAETSLTVKVLYAPTNVSRKEVNVTKQIVGSSLVVLNAESGECVIHISSPVSGPHFEWQFPYTATVNPMHGVYLLFGTAVIVGGIWVCCKFGKSGRRDPISRARSGPDVVLANDEEMTEGWDENWDDDWDEIREVKPPSRKAAGNASANGMASKSTAADDDDRNGWKDNWE